MEEKGSFGFGKNCADKKLWNSWDDATIAERYSGEVGEEYKERLSAKVEGKEYVPGTKPSSFMSFPTSSTNSRSQTPLGRTSSPSRPAATSAPGGKAKVDDKYFAGLGAANASRPNDLPPSQGGKYGGFGSQPIERPAEAKLPGFDDLQKDPVAALTKGFGWFTTTVGKTAKSVNEEYIQPTAAKVLPLPLPPSPFSHNTYLTRHQIVSRNRSSSPSPHHSRPSRARGPNRRQERSRRL